MLLLYSVIVRCIIVFCLRYDLFVVVYYWLFCCVFLFFFFFSSRRRHTRSLRDWSSDVCSSDLGAGGICRGARDFESVTKFEISRTAANSTRASTLMYSAIRLNPAFRRASRPFLPTGITESLRSSLARKNSLALRKILVLNAPARPRSPVKTSARTFSSEIGRAS